MSHARVLVVHTHVLQRLLPLLQPRVGVLQLARGRAQLVLQLDDLLLQCLHLLLCLDKQRAMLLRYLRSAGPFPSPRAVGWRSSASPGSGPGRSPAAASSSAAHGPPPPPTHTGSGKGSKGQGVKHAIRCFFTSDCQNLISFVFSQIYWIVDSLNT